MLWLIGGLALLLFALLASPVDLTFRVAREERWDGSVTIGWLYGLLTIPVKPSGEKEADRPGRKKSKKKKEKGNGAQRALALLRDAPFRRRALRFARELLRSIQLRRFRLAARIGFDDPADTGRLWGFLGPMGNWLDYYDRTDVTLVPVFDEATLAIDGEGEVRIMPLMMVGAAGAFLLSPVTLSALWRSR